MIILLVSLFILFVGVLFGFLIGCKMSEEVDEFNEYYKNKYKRVK